MQYLELVAGLVVLLVGGDLLVRGAIGIAERQHISPALVGLTIVALGTSAPELIVSVVAARSGHPEIAIGNVVGSNVANVLLVLGVPALLHPVTTRQPLVPRTANYMMVVSVLLVVLCFTGTLGVVHGLILLGVLTLGTVSVLGNRALATSLGVDVAEALKPGLGLPDRNLIWSAFITVGIAALAWGAELTVAGASDVARRWGVTEAAVAAGVIAVGTSLPELTTTLVAAFHRRPSVALGNVIGSNLLNVLAILGLAALVADIEVPAKFFEVDLWVMLATATWLWLLIHRGRRIDARLGTVFLLAYSLYLLLIF